jgi:hypothetical protein
MAIIGKWNVYINPPIDPPIKEYLQEDNGAISIEINGCPRPIL